MGTGYDVNEVIAQYEQVMGMGLFSSVLSELPSMLVNIAVYVFTALALYTIAQRRGIHRPWLAWIPVVNVYLLGCVSDHYRAVVHKETRSRRKLLLILNIVQTILSIVLVVLVVIVMIPIIFTIFTNIDGMTEDILPSEMMEIMSPVMGQIMAIGLLMLPMMIVSITFAVFYYIALHDVYKSCDPSNATLFLVLSILFSVCQPIFLFICRDKDRGMPFRQQEPPKPVMPVVEPWEKEKE